MQRHPWVDLGGTQRTPGWSSNVNFCNNLLQRDGGLTVFLTELYVVISKFELQTDNVEDCKMSCDYGICVHCLKCRRADQSCCYDIYMQPAQPIKIVELNFAFMTHPVCAQCHTSARTSRPQPRTSKARPVLISPPKAV